MPDWTLYTTYSIGLITAQLEIRSLRHVMLKEDAILKIKK